MMFNDLSNDQRIDSVLSDASFNSDDVHELLSRAMEFAEKRKLAKSISLHKYAANIGAF